MSHAMLAPVTRHATFVPSLVSPFHFVFGVRRQVSVRRSSGLLPNGVGIICIRRNASVARNTAKTHLYLANEKQ